MEGLSREDRAYMHGIAAMGGYFTIQLEIGRAAHHRDELGVGGILELEADGGRVAAEGLGDDPACFDVVWERRRAERKDEGRVRGLSFACDGYGEGLALLGDGCELEGKGGDDGWDGEE